MQKVEQSAKIYDQMFADGGYQGIYDLPYWHSAYYPLFRQVLAAVQRRGVRSVLEVGCGTGAFAHLVMERTTLDYHGFDFSETAVQKAMARTGMPGVFYTADATAKASYGRADYDCIVCTEVLEHIEEDLAAIANWRSGAYCVCSVPNYDSETHVRHFRTADEVRARYGELIDIDTVTRIKKPVLSDISVPNVLRALRWNRYRPRRFLEILGAGTFDSIGGWFLICGTKR